MTPGRRPTRRTIALLALFLALGLGLGWDGSPLAALVVRQAVALKYSDLRQVSPEELAIWMADPNRPPPLLVDARPGAQYFQSHIRGAVPLDPAAPDLGALTSVPRETPIVVYDGPGVGSAALAQALAAAGYTRVSNLEGGLFRWVNEGHPIEGRYGPATKVHPVSWTWGRLLKRRYR
ncbi:MAG TPA: rhodanese-like domain-containing protein [Gemmatimonadales bacterium]|jgi:rhodanese-related sulfurtransferase|nr:rhodanese-like domain-containing protein [Gemmatimonadales bacterium]